MTNPDPSPTFQHLHHRSQSYSLQQIPSEIPPLEEPCLFPQKRPKSVPILPSQHTPTMSSIGCSPHRNLDEAEIARRKRINRNFTVHYDQNEVDLQILLVTKTTCTLRRDSIVELIKNYNHRLDDVVERVVELGLSNSQPGQLKQCEIHKSVQYLCKRKKGYKKRHAEERKRIRDCLVLIDEVVDEMYAHFGSDSEGEME